MQPVKSKSKGTQFSCFPIGNGAKCYHCCRFAILYHLLNSIIFCSSPLHFLPFFCTSIFCSKEIASFHRPKAKWYPHENKVAAQLHGTAVSHGRMTAIVMTLGGKGIKLMVNADETPVSVKLKISKKLG